VKEGRDDHTEWLAKPTTEAGLVCAAWTNSRECGWRQVAIVTVFGKPILQGFDLLAQAAHLLTMVLDHGVLLGEQRLLLLDEFVSLRQLFS